MRLRNITRNDLDMLFNWRNHPGIRSNSFDNRELSLADHKKWFNNVLSSGLVITYILEIDGNPVGVIRFDIEDNGSAKINYLIDPSQQGNGFGTKILDLGVKKFFKENQEVKKVYGYVLKKNLASIRIFEKLSFNKVSEKSSEFKFEKSI